jgi:hypothetical protein
MPGDQPAPVLRQEAGRVLGPTVDRLKCPPAASSHDGRRQSGSVERVTGSFERRPPDFPPLSVTVDVAPA